MSITLSAKIDEDTDDIDKVVAADRFGLDPFEWLSLLELRVIDFRVAPGEATFALVLDPDDTSVIADRWQAKGEAVGELLVAAALAGRTAFMLECEGDCCSETWLADVVGVEAILGRRITGSRPLELPEHLCGELDANGEPRTRQEYDQCYGWELRSARGACTLAVRNSSNGYYGGSLRCAGLRPLDEVMGWRSITEDWSA